MLYDIFKEVDEFFDKFDHSFEKFFNIDSKSYGFTKYNKNIRIPVTEMEEKEKEIIVNYEIPGFDKKDINIDITENQIEVYGKKRKEEGQKKNYSKFYKMMSLPSEITREGVKASYKDGILKVIMPKSKKSNKTKIDIE